MDLGFLSCGCFGFLCWLPLAPLRCLARLRYLLGGLLAGASCGFMLGSNRWLSFLEVDLLHSVVRDALQTFAPNSLVDEPAMLVPPEFIPDDRTVVEFMDPEVALSPETSEAASGWRRERSR